MAIAFDALTGSAESLGGGTFAHTPVGTPRGVIVFVGQGTQTDVVSGVTYGGVAMTRVTGGFVADTAGEPCSVYAYFLGSGIPTGAQDVVVNVSGGLHNKRAVCITLTAAANLVVVGTPASTGGDAVDPSLTVSDIGGGVTALALAHLVSGQDATTSVSVSAGTELEEYDFGTRTQYTARSNEESDGSITISWTAAIEDVAAVMFAVKEGTDASVAGVVATASAESLVTTLVRDRIFGGVTATGTAEVSAHVFSLSTPVSAALAAAVAESFATTFVRDRVFAGTAAESSAAGLAATLVRDRIFGAELAEADAVVLLVSLSMGMTVEAALASAHAYGIPGGVNRFNLSDTITVAELLRMPHKRKSRHVGAFGTRIRERM